MQVGSLCSEVCDIESKTLCETWLLEYKLRDDSRRVEKTIQKWVQQLLGSFDEQIILPAQAPGVCNEFGRLEAKK